MHFSFHHQMFSNTQFSPRSLSSPALLYYRSSILWISINLFIYLSRSPSVNYLVSLLVHISGVGSGLSPFFNVRFDFLLYKGSDFSTEGLVGFLRNTCWGVRHNESVRGRRRTGESEHNPYPIQTNNARWMFLPSSNIIRCWKWSWHLPTNMAMREERI